MTENNPIKINLEPQGDHGVIPQTIDLSFARQAGLQEPPPPSDQDGPTADMVLHQALVLIDQGRREEADYFFLQGLRIDRNHPETHIALGQSLLARGIWQPGWEEYLWISEVEPAKSQAPAMNVAIWNGMQVPGRLLVIADQGYGDAFMWARYLASAADRCEDLDVAPFHGTEPIFRRIVPGARIVTTADEVRTTEYLSYCRLSSLPYILRVTPLSLPGLPYLPMLLSSQLSDALDMLWPFNTFRIGLAWKGNPAHKNDNRRSMPLQYFTSLFEGSGRAWVAIQPGMEEEAAGTPLVCLSDRDGSWRETADLIALLDLVITVDTAVAHLAAAMGKPVWILLPEPCDWRWGTEGDRSYWYPSAKLFRQPTPGNWPAVIKAVADSLADLELKHRPLFIRGG